MDLGPTSMWQPRPFKADEIDELIALARVGFPDDPEMTNAEFLRWQYFDNPAGPVIGWVAESTLRDELAGSYCVIPVRMLIGGGVVSASLSLNTMTHPAYRKQGIFTRLAELTYAQCAHAGIALTVGIPNDQSHRGLAGPLRFSTVGRRLVLAKPLRFRRILSRILRNEFVATVLDGLATLPLQLAFRRTRPAAGYDVVSIDHFDEKFDDLWQRSSRVAANMVVRDSAFLNWRFAACPTRSYKIFSCERDGKALGYVTLWIRTERAMRVGFITDLLVDPSSNEREVLRNLLAAAEAWAFAEGADLIAFHTPPNQKGSETLRSNGYLRVPDRLLPGPHTFMIRPHRPDVFDVAAATDFASWYITDADNDRP